LKTGKVMIEYIVIGGVNDAPDQAHALGALLKGKNVIVNLIPYNPTDVKEDYKEPDKDVVVQFEKILQQEYNILATIRRAMGQDIEGACGQLVIANSKGDDACGSKSVKDIEDLVSSNNNSGLTHNNNDDSGDTLQGGGEADNSNGGFWKSVVGFFS